jgi:hypothetical protein
VMNPHSSSASQDREPGRTLPPIPARSKHHRFPTEIMHVHNAGRVPETCG